jgi:heavy metal efflux system protein
VPALSAVIGADARAKFLERAKSATASVATLGMLPAAIATGVGSDVQRSLATVVAGGLFLATLLTLFIIPTFYFVIERAMLRRSERRTAVAESPA